MKEGSDFILAADEKAVIPVLANLKGYLVGGNYDNPFIKVSGDAEIDQKFVATVALAKKIKVYLAIPLDGSSATVVHIRPGGASADEERILNDAIIKHLSKNGRLRGYVTDGVGKERNYVRNMLLEAWERVGDNGQVLSEAIARPFGCLDPDHNQKARLSDLQYGGSSVPWVKGEDSYLGANVFLLRDVLPWDLFRRTDFACSAAPMKACRPEVIIQLMADVQAGKAHQSEALALMMWFAGYRMMRYSVHDTDPKFTAEQRAEVLFVGMAILLAFELTDNAKDAIVIQGFAGFSCCWCCKCPGPTRSARRSRHPILRCLCLFYNWCSTVV